MREIKFRAWDKKEKEMIDEPYFHEFESINTQFEYGYSDLIFMQYTGLKDKNGVEIYEGDIVRCTLGLGIIDYWDSYFRIFKPYDFSINLINEISIGVEHINNVEVIGNIYENAELLTN